jgi:hypothetical protein
VVRTRQRRAVHLQEVAIQVAERRPVTLLAVIRVAAAAVAAVVVALPIVVVAVVADRTNRGTRLLSSQIERLMYRPRRYDLLRNP